MYTRPRAGWVSNSDRCYFKAALQPHRLAVAPRVGGARHCPGPLLYLDQLDEAGVHIVGPPLHHVAAGRQPRPCLNL